MALYAAFYFITDSGRSPVKEFIDSLDSRSQRKFFYVKALLEEFGHRLPFPHAKYIGAETFELRFSGIEGNIRILYFFFHHSWVIFTHGFVKKSNKLRRKERSIAVERRREFLKKQL